MSKRKLITSESVTEGHPDKICDQISDSILDEIMRKDPEGRVACETMISTGYVMIAGEITTNCYVDISSIARETIRKIGYDNSDYGFNYDNCAIITSIDEQSPDIAAGVNTALEARENEEVNEQILGAGDQGLMYGFACNETVELMPLPISLAHELTFNLAKLRKESEIEYLRPDGKSQVTVEYIDGKPERIDTIIVSTQHSPEVSQEKIKEDLKDKLIQPQISLDFMDEDTKILVNPSGKFVLGGPKADAGLTGRKIIVDTYGGPGRHGGGALSGKDPTKVDRSGAYAARYVAKNIVAAGLAARCEVQIAYAIGVASPVSISVDTFGTAVIEEEAIEKLINEYFDLRPGKIIDSMELRNPIYKKTAAYGHFGRKDVLFPWEKADKAEKLAKKAGINMKIKDEVAVSEEVS